MAKASRLQVSQSEIRKIRSDVLRWYRLYGRSLPWRTTRDPYAIAVSEVMLQQTQVTRVIPKYKEWLEVFPNVNVLARARLSSVLRLWSGLGYNNRARRLREMAVQIVKKFNGVFPADRKSLLLLPGFGDYTAGAVASFAFRLPEAIVDTNVRRVFRRFAWSKWRRNVSESEIIQLAEMFLDRKFPDTWNHALMDLGTVVSSNHSMNIACPWPAVCKSVGANNRRSITHRAKAAPFLQSNRYVRGAIVRAISSSRVLTRPQLSALLLKSSNISNQRINQALIGLERDRIIRRIRGKICFQA